MQNLNSTVENAVKLKNVSSGAVASAISGSGQYHGVNGGLHTYSLKFANISNANIYLSIDYLSEKSIRTTVGLKDSDNNTDDGTPAQSNSVM